jgi:predicted alpha/beta superfamily hydrolase
VAAGAGWRAGQGRRAGAGEGKPYTDFIVKNLKPLIDARYLTLPGRADTAVMNSSMGGLASHYAIAQYPQVFGKAGVFSPAYWTAPSSSDFIARHPLLQDARVYLPAGDQEGDAMVPDVERMAQVVRASGHPAANTVLRIVPGAEHNERFWREELRKALLWMFAKEAANAR